MWPIALIKKKHAPPPPPPTCYCCCVFLLLLFRWRFLFFFPLPLPSSPASLQPSPQKNSLKKKTKQKIIDILSRDNIAFSAVPTLCTTLSRDQIVAEFRQYSGASPVGEFWISKQVDSILSQLHAANVIAQTTNGEYFSPDQVEKKNLPAKKK